MSLTAADETGGLVLTVDSVALREVPAEQLTAATTAQATSLFQVDWPELPVALEPAPSWTSVTTAEDVAALDGAALDGAVLDGAVPSAVVLDAIGGTDEDATLTLTSRVLAVVQAWLAGTGSEDSHLVVVTRGAVPAGGEAVTDPPAAAVWGMVRAAAGGEPRPDRPAGLDRTRTTVWSPCWARPWPAGSRSSPCAAPPSTSRASAAPRTRRPSRCSVRKGQCSCPAPVRWAVSWPGTSSRGTACGGWCSPAGGAGTAEGVDELVAELPARAPRFPWWRATSLTATRSPRLVASVPDRTARRAHRRCDRRRGDRDGDPGAAGPRVRAQGGRGAAPRRTHPGPRPQRVPRLLVGLRGVHGRGQRQLRGRERLTGRVDGQPPGGGPARPVARVGPVGPGRGHGGRHWTR